MRYLLLLTTLSACVDASTTGSMPLSDSTHTLAAADILDVLRAMPDVSDVREIARGEVSLRVDPEPGLREVLFRFRQPVDHDDPSRGYFWQRVKLCFKDTTAPATLLFVGYNLWEELWRGDLAQTLNGSQLAPEHRFFGESTPADGIPWRLLTVRQAAMDDHRLVERFRPVFTGAWLSTGTSKGGMQAVYHRRFFPGDVDATVAFVAPHMLSDADTRYPAYIATLGNETCPAKMTAVRRELLLRRAEILPRYTAWAQNEGLTFTHLGPDVAYELAVVELPFMFWQNGINVFDVRAEFDCTELPPADVDTDTLFKFFLRHAMPNNWSDQDLSPQQFGPYQYQAAAELGFPVGNTADIADLLTVKDFGPAPLAPRDSNPLYDPAAMQDIGAWVTDACDKILFIYGATDPYTAAAFQPGSKTDCPVLVVPGGGHAAGFWTMSDAQADIGEAALSRWLRTPVSTRDISNLQRVLE